MSVRFFETSAAIRREYPWPPAPLAIEQTAFPPPWMQRHDIPLTAPPFRASISRELMRIDVEGDCCEPHIPAGRKSLVFDARLSARDFDYVLIEASAEAKHLVTACQRDPAWLTKYAAGIPDAWVKQLRCIDGAAYMVERTSALPLGRCTVLGVLVDYRSLRCV